MFGGLVYERAADCIVHEWNASGFDEQVVSPGTGPIHWHDRTHDCYRSLYL
jgi:hypothetical protein